jgi:hypothetical protein
MPIDDLLASIDHLARIGRPDISEGDLVVSSCINTTSLYNPDQGDWPDEVGRMSRGDTGLVLKIDSVGRPYALLLVGSLTGWAYIPHLERAR